MAFVESPGRDRTSVLFEFGVDEVVSTSYSGDATERRRWRAEGS